MKSVLGIAISVLMFTAVPVNAAEDPVPSEMRQWQNDKPVMPVKFWEIIAQCETGRRAWKHAPRDSQLHHGLWPEPTHCFDMERLQRSISSWRSCSACSVVEEQRVIAERIAFKGHYNKRQGRYVWPVGVRGWGCYKIRPSAQALLCRSKHPLVRRWQSRCGEN